jgi:hypothetical protein
MHLAKKEVTSKDVCDALKAAEERLRDSGEIDAWALIKRAVRCCVAGRTFGERGGSTTTCNPIQEPHQNVPAVV